MNMGILDRDLVSHDEAAIADSTTTYGATLPEMRSIPDNAKLFDARVHFKTVPVGTAGTEIISINLCGGAATAPTTITQVLWTGTAAALAIFLGNAQEFSVGIYAGALKAFNRIGMVVAAGGAAVTPGVATSAIVPKV